MIYPKCADCIKKTDATEILRAPKPFLRMTNKPPQEAV